MKKIHSSYLISISILLMVYPTTGFCTAQKVTNNSLNPVEYLQNLTPDQAQALQQTAPDRLNNLTLKQKKELLQVAQDYLDNISPTEKKALIELAEKDLNIAAFKEELTVENVDKKISDSQQISKLSQQAEENQKNTNKK